MRDGINFVKFDGNHFRQERFVRVVDNAASLDDVWLVFLEPLGCPARIVWMWEMVGVEDTNVLCVAAVRQ